MALVPQSRMQEVRGITEHQRDSIKAFMQGAVYSWIKNCPGKSFAVRDLMGGENFEWRGTPLYVLYEKHEGSGKSVEAAIEGAAVDLGWLVKAVLTDDKRTFQAEGGRVNSYRWVGNED